MKNNCAPISLSSSLQASNAYGSEESGMDCDNSCAAVAPPSILGAAKVSIGTINQFPSLTAVPVSTILASIGEFFLLLTHYL